MELPEKGSQELTSYFNQREFVERTIAQIEKDLAGLFDEKLRVDLDSSANLLDDLIKGLTPVLQMLAKQQPEQLSQFTYRVDLGEKNFFKALSEDPSLQTLAGLIIEREARKVYLRMRFS